MTEKLQVLIHDYERSGDFTHAKISNEVISRPRSSFMFCCQSNMLIFSFAMVTAESVESRSSASEKQVNFCLWKKLKSIANTACLKIIWSQKTAMNGFTVLTVIRGKSFHGAIAILNIVIRTLTLIWQTVFTMQSKTYDRQVHKCRTFPLFFTGNPFPPML